MERNVNLYNDVIECLRARRIPQREIALRAGVPFSTVAKIAQGDVANPSVHTVQKLYDFFRSSPEFAEQMKAKAAA